MSLPHRAPIIVLLAANAIFPILLVADDATWLNMDTPRAFAFGEFLRYSPWLGWILLTLGAIHAVASLSVVRDQHTFRSVLICTAATVIASMIVFGLWEQSLSDKGGLTLQPELILAALGLLLTIPTIKYLILLAISLPSRHEASS